MFTRLAHLSIRRRGLVLTLSGLFVLLAAVLGTGVFGRLDVAGFDDPASESSRAARVVEDDFGAGQPNYVVILDSADGDVDSPASAAAGDAALEAVAADPSVAEALSYWSLSNAPPLRSTDGTAALVMARITGDDNELLDASHRITEAVRDAVPEGVGVGASGLLPVNEAVTSTIEGDLARAESVAVPITLVLLVIVFGGLVAAGLPLLTGIVAVLGTFLTLWVVTLFTSVSVFSINLVTAMGLGLAIDYSLFVVSRFREELARRPRKEWNADDRVLVEEAVVRTVETAGRTVAFSALTVAVSLSALLVFPMYFLRSFAFAGAGVTLVAAAASVVTLPAVLVTVGRRIDALSLRRSRRSAPTVGTEVDTRGFWYRTAMFAQRHALAVAGSVVAVLVLLGLPFLGATFGTPDERVLPEGDPARVATERLMEDFPSDEAEAFPAVARGAVTDAEVSRWAAEVSALDGVARVDAPTGRWIDGDAVTGPDDLVARQRIGSPGDPDGAVMLGIVPDVEPSSPAGEVLAAAVRGSDAPGGSLLVGGTSAEVIDARDSIAQRLPWALGLIAVSTFVLLFLMFGSVLIPLKAIVLNVLSLSATFGAMVWVFQDGNGADLLGFTPTGATDLTTPILMFCIAFGLSMDYEVFLLSRISEEYHRTGDNVRAVAAGLQRTGGIVTAAAALLAVTFLATATSSITFIKLFGLGLALAVLMDATVVRALLVPAFMRLAGRANWWAPAWMRRVHERFGLSEGEPPEPPEPQEPQETQEPVGDDGESRPEPLVPAAVG